MRKGRTIFIVISILVAFLLIPFNGQSIFSSIVRQSQSNNDAESTYQPKEATISVNNGSSTSTYTARYGQTVTIDTAVKKGSYLLGFFSDDGEKYFEPSGNSISVWQKEFPTEFTARWGDIRSLSCTSQTWAKDEAESFSSYTGWYFTLSDNMMNAINGNLDQTLSFTINFKGKEDYSGMFGKYMDLLVMIKEGNDKGDMTFASQRLEVTSSYKDYEVTLLIKASEIPKDGKVLVYFSLDGAAYLTNFYLRNVSVVSKFATQ